VPSPRSIRIPAGPPPPPIPGSTTGAETRRVKFGRPPRRQELGMEIQNAWRIWQKEDPAAAAAVAVWCTRRYRGGYLYESRTFGAKVLAHFPDTSYLHRFLWDYIRNARHRKGAK
jgi:hypothetical protein